MSDHAISARPTIWVSSFNDARTFLAARQSQNAALLVQIDLLGELGTPLADLDLLGEAIKWFILKFGPARATQLLEWQYPLAFAEFLTAVGIHDYRQGDYWSSVFRRTGLPQQNYPSLWGQAFERILAVSELEPFDSLREERALRFVSKFLAHAGIPTGSLDDFFGKLLAPALRSGEFRGQRADDVLDYWRRVPAVFEGVDQPVRRFLLLGGPIAHDFVDRCLELTAAGLSDQPLPMASDLGLPDRIVTAFAGWLERSSASRGTTSPVSRRQRRLSRPRISYDPWAPDALSIHLPSQALTSTDLGATWRVVSSTWSERVETIVVEAGKDRRSTESEVRIPVPFAVVEMELEVDGEVIRSWRFYGISSTRPVLVLNAQNGELIEAEVQVPADHVWVIIPKTAVLTGGRSGEDVPLKIDEKFQPLAGEWTGYLGEQIDLTGCSELNIQHDGNVSTLKLASQAGALRRPELQGGQRLSLLSDDNVSFTYEGAPPTLHLPLPSRSGVSLSPARWRIRVKSGPGSQPDVDISINGDHPDLVTHDEPSCLAVDLAAPEILGNSPHGRFEVVARGPLGHDRRFDLLFLPRMTVRGLDQVLAPDVRGAPEAVIDIETAAKITLAPEVARIATLETRGVNAVRIQVPGSLDSISLQVHVSEYDGPVELRLPLRRVKWSVSGLSEHTFAFSDRLLNISRDAIDQALAPALIVNVPTVNVRLPAQLRVEDKSGQCHYEYRSRPTFGDIRFPLREMLDSIRSRTDARLALILILGEDPIPVRVPVGHVTRNLQIANLAISGRIDGLIRKMVVTWDEPMPVTNRVLRLWSLWRLWEEPVQFAIDDGAQGEVLVGKARPFLPAGAYRAEIAVEDPWSITTSKAMPALTSGNCVDLQLGTGDEIDEHLEDARSTGPLAILEEFLARGDTRILRSLPDVLDDMHVHTGIQAALRLLEIDDANALEDERALVAVMHELKPVLIQRAVTFETLADLYRFEAGNSQRLRRLVVELGIVATPGVEYTAEKLSEARRHALWQLWPPLMLALDGDALWNGAPEVEVIAPAVLGTNVRYWLPTISGQDSSNGIPKGFRFSGTELGIDIRQIRAMRSSIGIMPTGPLDDNAWTLANFDWIIRLLDDPDAAIRAKEWLAVCLRPAATDLACLSKMSFAIAVGHVVAREPTADHGPLRMVPYVVGATALVERAYARGILQESALLHGVSADIGAGREAFMAAAELYTRDLCVMDMLLRH